MKKQMHWKGQKDFSSICLSQPVINPAASLSSQSSNWRSKWSHSYLRGCSHPSFTLPTGLGWFPPCQSLLQIRCCSESQEDCEKGEGKRIETWSQIRGTNPGLARRDIKSRKAGNRSSSHVTNK